MISSQFLRSTATASARPFLKPQAMSLAIISALASLTCASAFAQTSQTTSGTDNTGSDVAPVVIIGSRFPSSPDLAPIGATVITATDIRNAGVDNVNEAIRKLGGVYGRQNLYGTADFDLDMNGFGADSANNLVILLDGVRISESEQSVALLSSIPIDSVARIEIMRGGSSVLYGDGATGGVIQIITKQLGPTPLTGSITTELGQFKDRAGRAYLSQGGDGFNLSLNVNDQKSDNYRVNNAVTQQNLGGAATWYSDAGRIGLRIDIARQDSGFAGSLTLAQFQQDPRQTFTPYDNGSIATDRYTAFGEYNFGAWQVAAELSTRERTSDVTFFNGTVPSPSSFTGRQTEFTPRLRNITGVDGMRNEFVIGLDFMDWNRQSEGSYSQDYATQKSRAIYFRDEMKIDQARIAFGARREVFDKTSTDPVAFSQDNYTVVQGVNAWEVQGSYAFAPVVNVFANVGQSYRVANVDDNSETTVPNTPLLPQLSHDLELGTTLGDANQQLIARFFRHDITNEIYYFTNVSFPYGTNMNLDPTKRQGIALDAKYRLSKEFRLTAQAQHVDAVFTAGVNDGKELVLVPKNTVSAHLNWVPGNGQNAYIGGQWVDKQRYGGDFSNTCAAMIPSHATLDARYSQTVGAWELAVAGSNLTNKQYFSNSFSCMGSIYPDDGRQMKVTLRYSF